MANINQLVQELKMGKITDFSGNVMDSYKDYAGGVIAPSEKDAGNFLTHAGNKILANDRELTAKFVNAYDDNINKPINKFVADLVAPLDGGRMADNVTGFFGAIGRNVGQSTREVFSDIGEKATEIGGASARALQRLYASLKDQLPSGTTEKEGLGMVKFLSDMTPTQTGIAAGLGTLGAGYAVKKYLQRPKTSAMRGKRR